MVCTVRRYTGPFVLNSSTSSRNVCSPPVAAGNTTSRTASSGAASEASAMENRRFSLPVTFLNALISSLVTLRSARAPIRCTVAIQLNQRVGDLPFSLMHQRCQQLSALFEKWASFAL